VIIKGPFGLAYSIGLLIPPITSSRHYVIIAGGTGILPFLDFFFLLLKKVTYDYFQSQNDAIAQKFNSNNYHGMFNKGFSLTFFGAFRNDEDFYGKEIIENLYKICNETGKENFFNAYLKISRSIREY
jgi:predicted ferric reductase